MHSIILEMKRDQKKKKISRDRDYKRKQEHKESNRFGLEKLD